MPAPAKVFCSHGSPDKAIVQELVDRLRDSAEIDAWIDLYEIQGGADWVERINAGLSEAAVVLVCISEGWDSRPYLKAEIEAATAMKVVGQVRVIPVMIGELLHEALPPLLRSTSNLRIDEFERIVDAILDRNQRPVVTDEVAAKHRSFVLRMSRPEAGGLRVVASLEDAQVAEAEAPLTRALMRSYAEFLQREQRPVPRGTTAHKSPEDAQAHALEGAVERLGRDLGAVLFAGAVGEELQKALRRPAGQ